MKTAITGLVLVVLIAVPIVGRELVVDLNGGKDFTEIQAAIDASADGDTVLVKPGEYVITAPIDFNRLHDPRDSNSPPVKNLTVRSLAGSDTTVIRMAAEPVDLSRARVVVFENEETEASVLEGFTLTGGRGISCGWRSSPTLINCTIMGNSEGVDCASQSRPTLINCTIMGNSGRGLSCHQESRPTLTNCTIMGNSGTGVDCDGSRPTLTNCTIAGNSRNGVSCEGCSGPSLQARLTGQAYPAQGLHAWVEPC